VAEEAIVPNEDGAHRGDLSALEALERSVDMLSVAHRYHDPYTVEHQNRTAALSVAIGMRLGLGRVSLAVLRLAAAVHDIGKIAVPIQLLFRPDALTEPEYAQIQTHSAVGENVLNRLRTPFPIADIAGQHHERLDGSGYPRGLHDAEILPEARILAVADVFDAMSSKRPYRDGIPAHSVLDTLLDMSGRQLDADAVTACRSCILN
jgi:HD-GYP domain-containing protein (c-di-GMP phosphodiesterase class II)